LGDLINMKLINENYYNFDEEDMTNYLSSNNGLNLCSHPTCKVLVN